MNEWGYLAGMVAEQLLPDYYPDPENYSVEFDAGKIKALQEDRNAQWQRATLAATSNIITRDEAREEMGLDPIDDVPVFLGTAAPAPGEETEEAEVPPALAPFIGAPQSSGSPTGDDEQPEKPPSPEEELEEKRYREFVARRKREGKTAEISRFQFKHLKGVRLSRVLMEAGAMPNPFLGYYESLTTGSAAAAV
jgi:hypothetical protein